MKMNPDTLKEQYKYVAIGAINTIQYLFLSPIIYSFTFSQVPSFLTIIAISLLYFIIIGMLFGMRSFHEKDKRKIFKEFAFGNWIGAFISTIILSGKIDLLSGLHYAVMIYIGCFIGEKINHLLSR